LILLTGIAWGLVEVSQGDSSSGLAHFRKAVELKPDLVAAINDILYVQTKANQFDAALAELQWFYYWSTPLYVILIPPVYIFRRRKAAVEALTAILMVLFFSLTVWSIHYIGLNSTSLTVILSAALVATPVLIPGWKSLVALVTTLMVYVGVTIAEYKGIVPMAPVLGGYVPPSFRNPVALFIYSGIVLALTTTAFSLSYWMVSLARRRQEERDRAYTALKIEKDRVDRELLRTRRQMVEHRNDVARQIKSKLLFYGIRSPFARRYGWGQNYLQWLKELELPRESLKACFESLIELYEYLTDQLMKMNQRVKELSQSSKYRQRLKLRNEITCVFCSHYPCIEYFQGGLDGKAE
jgi:hypothetical protein